MCGIAGIISWKAEAASRRLEHMTALLEHRGPDDAGKVSDDGVYLGHRRLTIIDLTENGHQPMASEDESVWIIYNGEIYDTEPLRKELESRGHHFRSTTDTEVLIHLYEEEGARLFPQINGMFAFAIHDRKRRRLLLARDRLGVKPLFYAFKNGELIFASEIKAVLEGLGHTPSLRPDVIGQYILQGYASAPDTVFEDIYALPQGHYLDLSLDDLKEGRMAEPVEYWDAPFTGDDLRPTDEIEAELEELIADSARIRLVADVPLGAFLSGGIDSSTVVAMMARSGGDAVRTFTVDLPGTDQSERAKALAVSRRYNTAHTVINCEQRGAEEYWERLRHFDAPFNCASLLNAWLVSRAAREHVTVALSGDGGDELFGGYARYTEFARSQAGSTERPLLRLAGGLLPRDFRGRARLVKRSMDDFMLFFTSRHPVAIETAERLAGASLKPWVDRMRSVYEKYDSDRLTRAMYLDLKSYLADHVLAKVDSASMSVSLEVRVPLLDYRVVELAGRIPSQLKIKDGTGKWILKRIARRLLPEELIDQNKVGFDPPLAAWMFAGEMDRRLDELSQTDARFREILDGKLVNLWIDDLRSTSRWRVPQRAALWAVYQLDRWMQMGQRELFNTISRAALPVI
jgi:asparagine synthase (glutamine-hydrolysing)